MAHRTKNEIEELIAEIAPKPDVPALVRKLPVRQSPAATDELGPDRVGVLGSALPLLPVLSGRELSPYIAEAAAFSSPAPTPREFPPPTRQAPSVTALAPARYKVQFTARAELRDKLQRLQALLRQDLATVLGAAVTENLERLEAKRFGLTKTRRCNLAETDTSPRSRHLPAAVRRSVRTRDGDQCTFLLRNGGRCPERRRLEFHHRNPYGRGGTHDLNNVCLMCRQHNAYVAELDYGKEHMEQYQRARDART